MRCNVGKDPCKTVKTYRMTEVAVKPADLEMIHEALHTVSLPTWSEVWGKPDDKCSATRKLAVGPGVGLEQAP